MGLRLFIDDQRIPPEGWEVARTVTEAIHILSSSSVDVISLDHDIANNQSPFHNFSDENFSAVAHYLAAMKNPPKLMLVHSASRYGTNNINEILAKTGARLLRVSPNDYENEIREFLKKYEQRK